MSESHKTATDIVAELKAALIEIQRISFEAEADLNWFRNHQRAININSIANRAANYVEDLMSRLPNGNVAKGRIAAGKHDKQNKIEDVIAKMRQFADRHWMHDSCQVVREYADMLEAVVKGGRDSRGDGAPRAKQESEVEK